ncbi:MAG: hypothetical protein IKT58_04190 [Oscillospiraceae bacterium]|nr:hypothetical protein [Oscillospiraceae bacterium]
MKKLTLLLLSLVLAAVASGCVLDPAEDLYAVPLQPESFYDLQTEVEKLIADGTTYCPPTAGENQQTVQLVNLDGDKVEEAVVFLKSHGDAPLSVCIFDRKGENYSLVDRNYGTGYAFDCVWYATLDHKPGMEIILGRKIGEGVPQVLNVYTLEDGSLVELMSTDYAEFTVADLDGDNSCEIISFCADGDAQNGVAEYYRWTDGELLRAKESNLSAPVSAIKRIISGKMCANVPAVFVGSAYGENLLITDIFALQDGTFRNMTMHEEGDFRVETLREYYVYSGDIDEDGYIELPQIQALDPIEGDENSENQSLIIWFNLLQNGTQQKKCVTYHNYSAGWYVLIPEELRDTVAVTRLSGHGSHQIYSFVDQESGKELFAITAYDTDSAEQDMEDHGMELLTQKGDITYGCRYEKNRNLTLQDLREMFHFIRVDWNTGET